MMTRKRLAMESVLFAAAIYIGYFAFMMLQGMVLTKRHGRIWIWPSNMNGWKPCRPR